MKKKEIEYFDLLELNRSRFLDYKEKKTKKKVLNNNPRDQVSSFNEKSAIHPNFLNHLLDLAAWSGDLPQKHQNSKFLLYLELTEFFQKGRLIWRFRKK